MTAQSTIKQALEDIYASLHNDNENIDTHIAALKAAMAAEGLKEITVEPSRLHQNNRQGRKIMQAYFKKRGVLVVFPEK